MSTHLIIHISGASGSGKTTLGEKLKQKFGSKIIVKDIDDLRIEFIEYYYRDKPFKIINKKEYQNFINQYIVNNQQKPIIFVGLNNMPWWHKDLYYNLYPVYKYYIDIDDETIIKQKCLRLFKELPNEKMIMDNLIHNNKEFLKLVTDVLNVECNLDVIKQMNEKWNYDYKQQGYEFLTRDKIYNRVVKILTDVL